MNTITIDNITYDLVPEHIYSTRWCVNFDGVSNPNKITYETALDQDLEFNISGYRICVGDTYIGDNDIVYTFLYPSDFNRFLHSKTFKKWINEKRYTNLIKKYNTNMYYCVYKAKNIERWLISHDPKWKLEDADYTLIHKKHGSILIQLLKDTSIEIKADNAIYKGYDFIKHYDENKSYKILQSSNYFREELTGEVWKYTSSGYNKIFSQDQTKCSNTTNIGNLEEIPYYIEKKLFHLQPCFCKSKIGNVSIIFYEDLEMYDNYIITPITEEQLKSMPFIWDMYIKLLKG
jgi:hypothetical protein